MLKCLTGALLFILGVQIARSRKTTFDDLCFLPTWSNLTDSPVQVVQVVIPPDCMFGDVEWNYPMGWLHLVADPDAEAFTFCIGEVWAPALGVVRELTAGLNKKLQIPTKMMPVCTDSQNGLAELLVAPESVLYYVVGFSFMVIPMKGLPS